MSKVIKQFGLPGRSNILRKHLLFQHSLLTFSSFLNFGQPGGPHLHLTIFEYMPNAQNLQNAENVQAGLKAVSAKHFEHSTHVQRAWTCLRCLTKFDPPGRPDMLNILSIFNNLKMFRKVNFLARRVGQPFSTC